MDARGPVDQPVRIERHQAPFPLEDADQRILRPVAQAMAKVEQLADFGQQVSGAGRHVAGRVEQLEVAGGVFDLRGLLGQNLLQAASQRRQVAELVAPGLQRTSGPPPGCAANLRWPVGALPST